MKTDAPIRSELTWEEFAEMYRDAWPKPAKHVQAIAFGIAFILLSFGALLTYLIPPSESLVGPVFACLGPIVAIATVWDQQVRLKRLRQSMEDEALTNFRQLYSGPQEFSFSVDKLSLNRNGAERQIPWAGLTSVAERKRTIVFSTGDQVAVIARKSVGEDMLVSFHELILGNASLKTDVRVSLRDYFLASFAEMWRGNLFLLAIGNLAGVAAVIGLLIHLGVPSAPVDFFWGKLLSVAVLIAVLTMQFWIFPVLFFSRKEGGKLSAEYTFGERGFWAAGPDESGFQAWRKIRHFADSSRFLRLYRDESRYYLLPKRCFSAEQVSILTRLLESNDVRRM